MPASHLKNEMLLSQNAMVVFISLGLWVWKLSYPSTGWAPTSSEPVEQVIQEVFLSETVYPQERYELQLTTRLEWQDERPSPWGTPLLVEFGLTDRFMVEVETTLGLDPLGMERTSLGALYNFYSDRAEGWAFSTGFSLGLPPASTVLGEEDGLRYEPSLIAYKAFDSVFVNVSGEMEFASEEDGLETEGEVAIAVFFRAASQWFPTFELRTAVADAETEWTLAPGFLVHPGLRFEIGMAIPIQLAPTLLTGVMMVVTWEWSPEEEDEEDAKTQPTPIFIADRGETYRR